MLIETWQIIVIVSLRFILIIGESSILNIVGELICNMPAKVNIVPVAGLIVLYLFKDQPGAFYIHAYNMYKESSELPR